MHPFLILLPGPDWRWIHRGHGEVYGPAWVLQQHYPPVGWISKYLITDEFLGSVWNPEVALRLFCERNFQHL